MNALFVSHYPLPRTITLASLIKGEVLSPEKIRATTGGIAFLPYPFRFSDTSVNNPSVTVTENTILCQRGHHNYSLFIIHYTKSPPSFQTTDLDIN